jgi:hypothetical protein
MEKKTVYDQVGVAVTCRSYEEYLAMFALTEEELLRGPVLDAASGASSFAASARLRGVDAAAVDPLFRMDTESMRLYTEGEMEEAEHKCAELAHVYDWSFYGSPEEHRVLRRRSLELFHEDFARPEAADRYVSAELPQLPFADRSFHTVLCSHFLFLYGEKFDYDVHRESLMELLRVCRPGGSVRVYPLLDLRWNPYPRLSELLADIRQKGYTVKLLKSGLPFIPKSTELLVMSLPVG